MPNKYASLSLQELRLLTRNQPDYTLKHELFTRSECSGLRPPPDSDPFPLFLALMCASDRVGSCQAGPSLLAPFWLDWPMKGARSDSNPLHTRSWPPPPHLPCPPVCGAISDNGPHLPRNTVFVGSLYLHMLTFTLPRAPNPYPGPRALAVHFGCCSFGSSTFLFLKFFLIF